MTVALSELDLTGTFHCAAFSFKRTSRAVTKLYDLALQSVGVRSTQFAILTAVAKLQPVNITKLGEVLILDRTTLTRSLRLAKKDGWIEVSARSTLRQRFVTLTPKGVEALAAVLPVWRAMQGRFVAVLGSEHWEALRKDLREIASVATGIDPKP